MKKNSDSYKSIKSYLSNKFDCDTFCHTWIANPDIKMNVGPWSNLNSFSCKGNEIEIINELYKPKSFIYDEPLDQSKIIKFKNVRDINSP
jgi:hypothetical protein